MCVCVCVCVCVQVAAAESRYERQKGEREAERLRQEAEARTLRARRRKAREEAAAAAAAAATNPGDAANTLVPEPTNTTTHLVNTTATTGLSTGLVDSQTLASTLDTHTMSDGLTATQNTNEESKPDLPRYGGLPGVLVSTCGAQYAQISNPDQVGGPPVTAECWERGDAGEMVVGLHGGEGEEGVGSGGVGLAGLQKQVTDALGPPRNFEVCLCVFVSVCVCVQWAAYATRTCPTQSKRAGNTFEKRGYVHTLRAHIHRARVASR